MRKIREVAIHTFILLVIIIQVKSVGICSVIKVFKEERVHIHIISNPIITKVSCSRMGKQTSYNPALFFNGYFIGDTEFENSIIIEGSGFGLEGRAETRGIVTLAAGPNYYNVLVHTWVDNKIEIRFKVHPAAEPKNAHIYIKTAGKNSQTVSYDFKMAPAINGEQYGESTWWAAKRRREQKRTIPNPPYTDPRFKKIDASYEPNSGDLWKWNSEHQAYVEIVKVKTVPNGLDYLLTYTIDISEANSDHKGTPKIYFNTTVVVEKIYKAYKVYNYKIVSGTFGRQNGAQATHYFR
ncbi:MAG: hypothetical protein IPO78_16275 [Saprospiraceae bacterium]|nr:hypothetical protein [Saprospiraceae bacterium]